MIVISKSTKYMISAVCALFIFYLCLFPAEMLASAKAGLILWYSSVLPSVFPFLIISNVLIEIGAVHKLGRVLEPAMRPIFNVPGCGAFAWLMGCVSGYPVGAKITADFRLKGLITKDEAQRLLSFSNNPGPLFMLGAVGAAILGSKAAGYFIMATNYISSILVGILFRFYKSGNKEINKVPTSFKYSGNGTARSLGGALGDSVGRSIEVVLQIGGFILLFSAFIKILEISCFLMLIANMTAPVFLSLGVDESLITAFVGGVFEITNGIKMAGGSAAPFSQKVIVSGILVSFGGLSIFTQTVSFISETDISPEICFFAKVLQAALNCLLMILAYPFFEGFLG